MAGTVIVGLAAIIIIASASRSRATSGSLSAPEVSRSTLSEVVANTERFTSSSSHHLRVTLQDIAYGSLYAGGFNGTWISNMEIIYANGGGIHVMNVENNSLSYQVIKSSFLQKVND